MVSYRLITFIACGILKGISLEKRSAPYEKKDVTKNPIEL